MSSTMLSTKMMLHSALASQRQTRVAVSTRAFPVSRTQLRQRQRRTPFVVFAEPELDIEQAVKNAEETCEEGGNPAECATAWDTVEELSAAKAHKKEQTSSDPLEKYCEEEPDADECRVYED